jgi:dipeptidyl aminopeptidase/acylaminoacyl peptidase
MQHYNLQTRSRRLLTALGALALGTLALSAPTSWAQTARVVQGGLILDGVPATDPALTARLQRWQQSRPMRLLDWMSDGSLLVASRVGDAEQVLRVSAPLHIPEQLSFFGGAIQSANAQAYASVSLALTKTDATGASALYLLDVAARRERQLVAAADGVNAPLWAHDSKRLVYASHLRNGVNADLYVRDVQGGTAQLIASGNGDWQALDWSRDDRFVLALNRDMSGSEQLHRIELTTLTVQSLAAPPVKAANPQRGRRSVTVVPLPTHISAACFTPDGRSVIALSDEASPVLRLQLRAIDSGETQILSLPMSRDVEHFALSADARYLAYDTHERGESRLTLLDRRAGVERIISGLPRGAISTLKFDRAGARLAVNIEHPTSPADVYVLDAATGNAQRWTQSELGPIDVATLSTPVAFRFRTVASTGYGGFEPNAMIYRPRATAAGNKSLPVLIMLPTDDHQALARFDAQLQMLVNELGVAVVVPALRSVGGRVSREYAVREVGALLAWVGIQPDLDRNQVAIAGSGVYSEVALAALARFGERLQRGVVVDGTPDASDVQQLQRSVLIARGFQSPQMPNTLAELLLWRARAAKNEAWLIANTGDSSTGDASRTELARVTAQFIGQLLLR